MTISASVAISVLWLSEIAVSLDDTTEGMLSQSAVAVRALLVLESTEAREAWLVEDVSEDALSTLVSLARSKTTTEAVSESTTETKTESTAESEAKSWETDRLVSTAIEGGAREAHLSGGRDSVGANLDLGDLLTETVVFSILTKELNSAILGVSRAFITPFSGIGCSNNGCSSHSFLHFSLRNY